MTSYFDTVETGQPHFPRLPAHWRCERLKFHLQLNDGGVWGEEPDGEGDTIVLRSTEQSSNGRWTIEEPALRKLNPRERKAALLNVGDLVVTKASGSSLHIGKTTLVGRDLANLQCCFSNFMQRLRTRPSLQPRLAWYILNSRIARDQFALLSNSTTGLANLNPTIIGDLVVPIAPEEEQIAISTFLDHETGKIDTLIAEQERLIALLDEKRRAVISHAVTKGLNPDAPMKHSGIEWLGEVPAHWQIRKISSLITKITNGYVGPTRDILTEDGVRYIQSLHVKDGCIKFSKPYYVSEEWSMDHKKSILKSDDVVIVQTGDIGQSAVVTDEFEGCNCHALIIISPLNDIVSGAWIAEVLNSSYGSQVLRSIQTGALHPHLNCRDVRDVYVPIPPLNEQEFILNSRLSPRNILNDLRSQAGFGIEILKERRSALISAAVTGKIDVRRIEAEAEAA